MVKESPNWYSFQEDIKNHFESLGMMATTNARIEGVRGSHDIDVLVKPKFLGRDITWLVEAKYWNSNIPKEKVLTFISIIQNVGADRGFLISNLGFQSGAYESAKNTNVELVNFHEFKDSTREYINTEVIKHYEERFELLYSRYWSHSKRTRRDYGLRHDITHLSSFSGTTLLQFIESVFDYIKIKKYPISSNTGLDLKAGEDSINDFHQACNWLNLNLNLLDRQLLKAEVAMVENGDFQPNIQSLKKSLSDDMELQKEREEVRGIRKKFRESFHDDFAQLIETKLP